MGTTNVRLILSVLALLAMPLVTIAAAAGNGNGQPIVLDFEPTITLLSTPNGTNPSASGLSATAWMVINQASGDLNFFVRGARPNTLYTVWTVFRPLKWCSPSDPDFAPGCPSAFKLADGSMDIKPGFTSFLAGSLPFYPEAGAVAPTASTASEFTSGMGLDPGATFFTNNNGDGQVHVKLDYNLLGTTYDDGPPVGNVTVVAQCALPGGPPAGPSYMANVDAQGNPKSTGLPAPITSSNCPKAAITLANGTSKTMQPKFTVTSSWLRKYIVQIDPADRAAKCANYDPLDPTSIFWQCIDPATVNPQNGTGLPRVWRYPFDHFRLAAHPDELTHGFIGGSAFEHAIDFVGRRCTLTNTCP